MRPERFLHANTKVGSLPTARLVLGPQTLDVTRLQDAAGFPVTRIRSSIKACAARKSEPMSRRSAHGYQLLRPFRVSRASCASCAVMAFKSSNVVTPILASTSKRLNPRSFVPVVRASHHFACIPESRHFLPPIAGDAGGTTDSITPVHVGVGTRGQKDKRKKVG